MGQFIVRRRLNGDFQFSLKAGNGEIILTSQGYSTKESCGRGVESVRLNSQNDERYERRQASNGNYFFVLKAANGEIIGTSEMYISQAGMENGITSVKKNAHDSGIIDHS